MQAPLMINRTDRVTSPQLIERVVADLPLEPVAGFSLFAICLSTPVPLDHRSLLGVALHKSQSTQSDCLLSASQAALCFEPLHRQGPFRTSSCVECRLLYEALSQRQKCLL